MSELLTEEEQVERIKSWWGANSTSIIVGLVLAVGAILGWRAYQDHSRSAAESASDAYREYLDTRGIGGSAEAALAALNSEYAGTVYQVFAYLYQAKDAAEEEDWPRAEELLMLAMPVADDPVVKDLVRVRIAKVQYQLDRLDATLDTLAAVQSAGFKGIVAEVTGDVHFARGETALAREAYQAGIAASTDAPRSRILELKLASLSNDP